MVSQAFVTPVDIHEATGRTVSLRSAYRVASQLGALRIGRRILVPVEAVRRRYGDRFAQLAQRAAEARVKTPQGTDNRGAGQ